jgi:hypothetical protein
MEGSSMVVERKQVQGWTLQSGESFTGFFARNPPLAASQTNRN